MNVVNTRHNITDSVNTTTKRYHQLRHEPNKLVTPNYNINGENFIVNHIDERERERERERDCKRFYLICLIERYAFPFSAFLKRSRVLNLIISHMSRTGTPLIKVNEGMTF